MLKLTWVFLALAIVSGFAGAANFSIAPIALPVMFLFAILALVCFVRGTYHGRPSS